jgi:serine-type D-Ala-D-Ala carboxypeptidase/endopeptidase (penicillin-binding protein 4)
MKNAFNYVVIYFSLVVTNVALAQSIQVQASQILKSENINLSDVSIQVTQKGKSVLDINEADLKIPASISKIATSYGVLKILPLNYRSLTEIYYDKKNIYIKGHGDSGFVSESLWNLVNDFKRKNISIIEGDIIIDDSLFDSVRYDESRESTRVDRSYDAPVSAMSFNWNSVNIFIRPLNGKVSVVTDPENDYFSIKNKAVLSSSKKVKDLIISVDQKNRIINISGEVSDKAPEKVYFKNVADPVLWVGENLKSFLKQRGVIINGKIRKGVVSDKALFISMVESKPLSSTLSDMNKFSNNFVAEMLTKKISEFVNSRQATLQDGISVIKNELQKINVKGFTLVNPSGLTRENRFSAQQMNQVLDHIKNDFKIFPSFVESLPISGIDGTLKKRMKDTKAEGYVRAKTGYLDGVVSLAGYVSKPDSKIDEIYTFTFIYNGPKDEALVRKAFDKILVQLVNQ